MKKGKFIKFAILTTVVAVAAVVVITNCQRALEEEFEEEFDEE